MTIRPRRSALYMPGSNLRALEKARTLDADVVIFDLEDAVAPSQKETARAQVMAAITAGGYGRRELVIRINGLSTPWGRDDLMAAGDSGAHAVLLPKVASPGDITRAAHELNESGVSETLRLWAMMETPMAILSAESILRTAIDPMTRLDCLVMGTNDLAKDMRARLTRGRAGMLPLLALCVTAARAYGLDILDGVFGDLQDEVGLRAECEQGRDLGMDGKTLIHPGQLAAANDIFRPSAEEIAWARKVVDAFAQPAAKDAGVIALEGKMVERLHEVMARRTLAIVEALAQSGN
jgi:citrate lyase subunit beta/citryl-CoA lyase